MTKAACCRAIARLKRDFFSVETHIVTSYQSIRNWMGVFAIAYPFILWWGGVLYYGCGRQPSISAQRTRLEQAPLPWPS